MNRDRKNAGFTLVELMIVVIILSTLAAMIIPRFAGRSEESKKSAAQVDISSNINNALDLYEMDNGAYPTTEQGLIALAVEPTTPPLPKRWKGPYVKKKEFKDPWGNPYQYRAPGTRSKDYDLYSFGPNGVEGGGDDIGNWEEDHATAQK
jgi:general secretion pathway protein G